MTLAKSVLQAVFILGIVTGLAVAATLGWMWIEGRRLSQVTVELVPCEQEDSDDCYWDAQTMGNGQGRSFIRMNGQTYYLEEK